MKHKKQVKRKALSAQAISNKWKTVFIVLLLSNAVNINYLVQMQQTLTEWAGEAAFSGAGAIAAIAFLPLILFQPVIALANIVSLYLFMKNHRLTGAWRIVCGGLLVVSTFWFLLFVLPLTLDSITAPWS